MAAGHELKVYTGASAGTEQPVGDATNWNLQSIDAYDAATTDYQDNPIVILASGTAYSFERWLKVEFTGAFNAITNVLAWKSAGSFSDAGVTLWIGETDTGVTPVDTNSAIATTAMPSSEGTAIDITPAGGISSDGDQTDFLVIQLDATDAVTTPGDIGTQTLTFQYDES